MLEIDVIPDVPVPPYRDLPVFDRQRVPGQQLLDAAEQRGLADRVLERQVFGERGRIGVDLRQKRHQGLCLRRKYEEVADDRVIERLDTEPVARAE